jgi:hypothetical protein
LRWKFSIDIAERKGELLRRRLCSAERFSERATARALRCLNTPDSRSSALLVRMTCADQRRVRAMPSSPASDVPAFHVTGKPLAGVAPGVDAYRAAVARAAALAGGVRALSLRLRLPAADLTRWILGTAKPSRGTYLRVVDFILEESRRRGLPPPKRGQDPFRRKGS